MAENPYPNVWDIPVQSSRYLWQQGHDSRDEEIEALKEQNKRLWNHIQQVVDHFTIPWGEYEDRYGRGRLADDIEQWLEGHP